MDFKIGIDDYNTNENLNQINIERGLFLTSFYTANTIKKLKRYYFSFFNDHKLELKKKLKQKILEYKNERKAADFTNTMAITFLLYASEDVFEFRLFF